MLREILLKHIKSQAEFVEVGYGQVEPNHLSAQRTAQIYAQLPADPAIEILEQGQFVKYDYAAGLVNFTGAGEWMLVYNEIKLYREHQLDCEFAMLKGNYQARVYSPLDGKKAAEEMYGPTRFLQGRREKWDGEKFVELDTVKNPVYDADGKYDEAATKAAAVADFGVASEMYDYYEMNDINNPEIKEDYRRRLFMKLRGVKHPEAMMPANTTMVPRLFKTNVGDHFTTNLIHAAPGSLKEFDLLAPRAEDGILEPVADMSGDMVWQVAKVYTMPDHQAGVKVIRIK